MNHAFFVFTPAPGIELHISVDSEEPAAAYICDGWTLRLGPKAGELTNALGKHLGVETTRDATVTLLANAAESDFAEESLDSALEHFRREPIKVRELAWADIFQNALTALSIESSPLGELELDVHVPKSLTCSSERLVASFIDAALNYFSSDMGRRQWAIPEEPNASPTFAEVRFFLPAESSLEVLKEAVRRQQQVTLESLVQELEEDTPQPDGGAVPDHLPSPVAVGWANLQLADDGGPRFMQARAMAETLMHVMTLTCLTAVDPTRPALELAMERLGNKPTLGVWMKTVRGLEEVVGRLFPATAAVLWRTPKTLSRTGKYLLEDFPERRNRGGAHGMPTEAEFRNLFAELSPHLDALVSAAADDWRQHPLVVQRRVRLLENDRYEYAVQELRDSSATHPPSKLVTNQRLMERLVYVSNGGSFICVEPLVVCQTCPTCHLQEVFLIEKIDKARPSWRSARNHDLSKAARAVDE